MEPPWPASARGDSWMRGEGCGIGSGWLRGERGSRLLPGVTALTHLSLHHNLSGNAGHLTVCHRVGASPANQCQEPGMKTRTQDQSQTEHKAALKLTSAGIQIH